MSFVAVIPAAGEGTRLRPHTYSIPKSLVSVAGKPILAHIIDRLEGLGMEETVVVVGHMAERVRAFLDSRYDMPIHLVTQKERLGLGHAISVTRELVRGRPMFVVLGDTIVRADLGAVRGASKNYLGVKEVDDPRRFGVAELAGGRIARLVEKPERPKSNLALVGLYFIVDSELLFECLEELRRRGAKTKGEFQLTDALQMMIDRGEVFHPLRVDEWYDCGKIEALLETNTALLENSGAGVRFPKALIIEPVSIGESCIIENSVVGPYVSIAGGTTVRDSIVRSSIIDRSAVVEQALLEDCVIGERSVVRGHFRSLSVGEGSEVCEP